MLGCWDAEGHHDTQHQEHQNVEIQQFEGTKLAVLSDK
jgi:membrane protein implicated in regulation of membrane protease activity